MNTSEYKSKILAGLKDKGSDEANELNDLARDEHKIDELISDLTDNALDDENKLDAINTLNAIKIFSPILNSKMATYVNGLRGLIESENPELRKGAIGCLAVMKDEVAQERLQKDLQSDKKEKVVPTHQAIAMLGFDEKALDHSIVREIVRNPPDIESLVEAVRHLPADEESFELLSNVLEDDNQPIEARSMIPDIINNYKPKEYISLAKKIIEQKGPEQELMPYLAKGIAGIQNKDAKDDVDKAKIFITSAVDKASKSLQKKVSKALYPNKPS